MPSRPAVTRVALAVLATAATAASALAAAPAAPAAASTVPVHTVRHAVVLNAYEVQLVNDVNATRVAHHLTRLRIFPGTMNVARAWASSMSAGHNLMHNPRLVPDVAAAGCRGWSVIAENVGMGPAGQPGAVFAAYLRSPEHRANILAHDVQGIGVGATTRGGVTFDTLDFVTC